MKKLTLSILIILIGIVFTGLAGNQVQVIQEKSNEINLQVELHDYTLDPVQYDGKIWTRVSIGEGSMLQKAGAPELPKWSKSILVSDFSSWTAEVYDEHFIELENIDILPSKGNLTRDNQPSAVPYTFGIEYQTNAFYPGNLTSLSEPYIIRDKRGIAVQFQAFQYNPVTRVLRIYTTFKVRVYQVAVTAINPLVKSSSLNRSSGEFESIFKRQFINYPQGKYTTQDELGEMLVICHPNFIEVVQPLVSWKIQKGIRTTLVDVTTIGNAANIKTYIANFYNTHNLTWVLLVGDAAYVPSSSTTAGDSDNNYGFIVGNDHYPDVFMGRFSAETVAHAQTMVDRVLNYELNPVVDNHYEHILGIGSSQGPGDDNEMDYQHIRNMQTDALGFTYTSASEFFDGSQGGLDASGDPTSAGVSSQLNAGAGALVYTGHGSNTSFGTSGYSNTQVNALNNTGKLPFIWAVACVNGNFVGTTCFAEAWTRAQVNNQPTGAIATLMSTINQSWDPPMCGQDEMIDILTETYPSNILRSFGGISMSGCMKMNDEYNTSGYEMTDTWTCFGDPSIMVRTATPISISVTHLPSSFIGMTSFSVHCNFEGAFAALTNGDSILGTAYIQNGVAQISHPVLNQVGSITLTVTGFNVVPYVAFIDIVPNEGPFVSLSSFQVNDASGNQNYAADFGETFQLNLSVLNVGIEQAVNVIGTLSSSDLAVTIINNQYNFGNIDSATTIFPIGVFTIQVANPVEDQQTVDFTLTFMDDSSNTWTSYLTITLQAPKLELELVSVTESAPANFNGRLDAGERFIITLKAMNVGHSGIPEAGLTIQTSSPYLTMDGTSYTSGALDAAGFELINFTGQTSFTTPIKENIEFMATISYQAYESSMEFENEIGSIIENWESAGFTSYSWSQSGNLPWTLVQSGTFEGNYAAKSGAIGDSQSSTMQLTVEVLEAGDISFYKRVSCEEMGSVYYDYLDFQIDGISKGKWAGEVAWSKSTYPISTGNHTLKWVYTKDSYYIGGSDCAWVDLIDFPKININFAPFITNTDDTIQIQINQPYFYTLEAFDQNAGDILTFTADTLPDGFTLTSASNTTALLSGNATAEQIGYHTVTIEASDGIASPSSKTIVLRIDNLVETDEFSSTMFSFYPNPAQSVIQFEGFNSAGILSIYSVTGAQIKQIALSNSNIEIDISDLSNGVYLIGFKSNGPETLKRLIIQR
ncbi:MAG: T9SS type A sorting domain-containing protein [Bacteroidales bacterium]|nr:T9SS type A sorting domain-containing protein [Bacteroidales bacterium]